MAQSFCSITSILPADGNVVYLKQKIHTVHQEVCFPASLALWRNTAFMYLTLAGRGKCELAVSRGTSRLELCSERIK